MQNAGRQSRKHERPTLALLLAAKWAKGNYTQYTFLEPHPYQERMIRLSRKVRGVRCLGSVALELCEVAAGRADLFVTMRSSPWDHNAARIILEEAGGAVFTVDGDELPLGQKSTVLAFNAMELKDCILCV